MEYDTFNTDDVTFYFDVISNIEIDTENPYQVRVTGEFQQEPQVINLKYKFKEEANYMFNLMKDRIGDVNVREVDMHERVLH